MSQDDLVQPKSESAAAVIKSFKEHPEQWQQMEEHKIVNGNDFVLWVSNGAKYCKPYRCASEKLWDDHDSELVWKAYDAWVAWRVLHTN